MFFVFLLLPLLAAFFIWFLAIFISKKYVFLIISHSYICLLFVWYYFFLTSCFYEKSYYLNLGSWIECGSFQVFWGFELDSVSLVMLGLVTFVSTAVHFFSVRSLIILMVVAYSTYILFFIYYKFNDLFDVKKLEKCSMSLKRFLCFYLSSLMDYTTRLLKLLNSFSQQKGFYYIGWGGGLFYKYINRTVTLLVFDEGSYHE